MASHVSSPYSATTPMGRCTYCNEDYPGDFLERHVSVCRGAWLPPEFRSGARRPHSMGSTEVTTAATVMAPTAGAVLLTLRSRQRRPQNLPADGSVASDPFVENRWQSPAPQVQITYGEEEEEDGRQRLRVYVALALGLPQAVPSGAAAEAPQWPAATALALGTTRPLHITLAELNLVNCSAACIAALASSLQKKVRPLTFTLCLLYTSPSPRDRTRSRMPSSA